MDDELAEIHRWLEAAQARGALGCEVLRTTSAGIAFRVDRASPHQVTEHSDDRLVVRVWREGGREGTARGAPDAADAVIDAALAQAEDAPEDLFAGPVDRLARAPRGLGIDDRRYSGVGLDDRVDVVSAIGRSVRTVDRGLTASGLTWSDRRTRRVFGNSRGIRSSEWSTTFAAEATVTGSFAGERVTASERVASRSFATLASVPYGANLARTVAAVLVDGADLDPGPTRVVLGSAAVARLFERIALAFDAPTIAAGGNFLVRDGVPVPVHPRIHLLDDGQAHGGLRSHGFDDRGVVPRPLTLIKEGRVDERLLDPNGARRAERHPTGHWFGDRLRPSNLALRGGTRSINAITSELGGRMLRIDHLPDLTDAVDLASGRFDCTISGRVLDANKPIGAVRNRRLTGDLAEVLASLVKVCSDTDRIRHVDAPGMILDGFTLH